MPRQDNSTDGGDDTYRPVGAGQAPQFADDDPWFGSQANPEGRSTIPDLMANRRIGEPPGAEKQRDAEWARRQ